MASSTIGSKNQPKLFYGWKIVIAATLVVTITFGVIYTFGVLLPHYQKAFNTDSATVSAAYSICLFVYTVCAIMAGWAFDKFGPRKTTLFCGFALMVGFLLASRVNAIWQLYLCYALIGLGMSPSYNPMTATVSRWFKRKIGIALGIVVSGVGAGPLILAPLISFLAANLEWRLTLVILGLVGGGLIIGSAFVMKNYPSDLNLLPDGDIASSGNQVNLPKKNPLPGFTLKQALKTKLMWQLFFVQFVFGFGIQVLMSHLVSYAEWRQLDSMVAATVLSTVSGISILGRLVIGSVADRTSRSKWLAASLFGQGIMIFALSFSNNYLMLFIFAGVAGLFYGGYVPQIPAMVGENLGLGSMGIIMGASSTAWAIGSTISPILAGHIVDATGNYPLVFMIAGVVLFSGGIVSLLLRKPAIPKHLS